MMRIVNKKKQQNPLALIWNVVSVFGTILGLVSFADDFVTWKNISVKLLDTYRSIVHYPFNLFQIKINDYLLDYLFIGSLCGGSFYKALTFGINNGYLRPLKYETGVKFSYFALYLLFWPVGIIITLKQVLFTEKDVNEREIKIRFVQWLMAVLIGFVVILILNTMIPDKL